MLHKGNFTLHGKICHQLTFFRPPWTCGQCEQKVYLWCMHCKGYGFCLTTAECPMRGRIPVVEIGWLYKKWETEVDVRSLLQATEGEDGKNFTPPYEISKSGGGVQMSRLKKAKVEKGPGFGCMSGTTVGDEKMHVGGAQLIAPE